MIVETGTVTKTQNGEAVVLVRRGDSCASCGAGCTCGGGHDDRIMMKVIAHNGPNAQVGDRVEVALSSGKLLTLSLITYILPLVFLFIGAIIGKPIAAALGWTLDAELASAFFGIGFLIASFLGVTLIMRRYRPGGKISPSIIKILPIPEMPYIDVEELKTLVNNNRD